jgi:hypothetical protein
MHKRIFCLAVIVFLAGSSSNSFAADSAKEIVEKAIEAHGGAANLKKYSAAKSSSKGTLYILGQEIPIVIESTYQQPDKLKNVLKLDFMGQKTNLVQIYNAGTAKMTTNDMVTPLSDAQKDELKEEVRLQALEGLIVLLDKSCELSLLDKSENVGDKEVVGVLVKSKGFKDAKLFFDKKTNALVKMERRGLDPTDKEVDQVILYSEMKKFDGILRPLKSELKMDGKVLMETETTNYKHLEKVEKKEFDIDD